MAKIVQMGIGLILAFLASFPLFGGTILGKVVLEGKYDPAGRVTMDSDALIRFQRSVAVSEKGGLGNVVLSISGVPGDFPASGTPLVVNQVEKTFQPHVLPVLAGEKVVITNSDGILHNVHVWAGKETLYNIAMPSFKKQITIDVPRDQVVILACDVHPHMRAWILPQETPFFAVSRETGLFSIEGVPEGTFTIRAWHEVFGTLEQTVTVKAGEEKTPVLFKFVAP